MSEEKVKNAPSEMSLSEKQSSVDYTIMGKTTDLTVVQKTNIDTLHKEGKTQKVIAKEADCSQSSVFKHINMEVKGRKRCGRKKCTSNSDNRTLERIVKQNPFKNVGEIHKEWTAAGVNGVRKRLTWAKDWTAAEWSKVMFSDESKVYISFENQGPRVWRKRGEAQNPCCLRSSVKFPQSVMVWGAMSSAGVGPLCFLRSKVNAAVYQDVLEHFMLPAADQLYGDADFIFQQVLGPAHSAKATSTWFKDHGILVLNWPANSPDLNPN
ncbi:Transposable element Tcb2 transposase [Labeo rohita]|uniref:Transposable element Tcb2 transposase n=1 Tax=Labeo rohita TaxID=84645 RepID=A0ABQ8LIT7_LABRO|nr:Transposable element Tcb2 transposase [Labeo rohita]